MALEQPGDAAARPGRLALVSTLAALIVVAVVVWWQFSGEAEQDAREYCDRGLAYAENGHHDRAIANFTMAIEIKPDYALAYGLRAVSYNKKGDHDRAIADFTKAIELDPDGPMAATMRPILKRMKEKRSD